jgi:hypothetical protein
MIGRMLLVAFCTFVIGSAFPEALLPIGICLVLYTIWKRRRAPDTDHSEPSQEPVRVERNLSVKDRLREELPIEIIRKGDIVYLGPETTAYQQIRRAFINGK